MSKESAEHHQKAAEHYDHAARHHREAAKAHAVLVSTNMQPTMPTPLTPMICMQISMQRKRPSIMLKSMARSNKV
jgi:hypothetical protein